MTKTILKAWPILMASVVAGCGQAGHSESASDKQTADTTSADQQALWPKLDIAVKTDPAIEQQVDALLATMTLEQKVAQMIQPEIRDITVEDMRQYGFGSYLNGGGAFPNNNKHSTPQDWIDLAEALYQASVDDSLDGATIPTMWGTDAVHGHNNVIGATLFPHNIGLGAANNPALIEKIAEVTAVEVMATGIDWVFAPTVAVVRDDRWGRTYEGYSEDPAIVRDYASAIVQGLQGAANADFLSDRRVISTVKHFVGDGGTVGGDDQGDNLASEHDLYHIHAQGYVGGLTAGAQSVMASFNSWHGKKNHGNKYLLTDVLKDKMGFDGFVVGDWNGHGQVSGCSNESCPQAVNAGLDIFMVPTAAWKPLYHNTIAQVQSGEIAMSRIDDAVKRILRVKFRAGLFNKPSPANRPYSGRVELIGHADHRAVAKQAVRESLVLLKNNNQLLPLAPGQRVLVAGDGADNIGKQSGGWTITWQGTHNTNADFPGGTSIFAGIKSAVESAEGSVELSVNGNYRQKPDVAIVVFGEEPYAEGHGDRDNLEYQRGNKTDLALLKKLQADNIPVVSLFISGRPMWVNAELNASDAFVAVWLPGSEGAAIAEVLFTDINGEIQHDFKGKLSYSWPKSVEQTVLNIGDKDYDPLFAYGYGLTYASNAANLPRLDESLPQSTAKLEELKLFDGAAIKPWHLWLVSGDQRQTISASVHQVGALNYRTVDKTVQEDAFQITSAGGKRVGIEFNSASHFREDLMKYRQADAALQFSLKRESDLTSMQLSMNCAEDCSGALDISEQINALPNNQWQTFSVDLGCFSQAGADFARMVSPFTLVSDAAFTISLADIKFVPNTADSASVQCPQQGEANE